MVCKGTKSVVREMNTVMFSERKKKCAYSEVVFVMKTARCVVKEIRVSGGV